MRIGLTYDLQTDGALPRQAEYDAPETIAAVTRAIERAGHVVVPLGSPEALLRLASAEWWQLPEMVFNLAEGGAGRCREAWAPALLETLGVPYSGSGPSALMLSLDKQLTKRLCQAYDIPTPPWMCVAPGQPIALPAALAFPLIVKPRYEGSAIGIDAAAIVRDARTLEARVRWATAAYAQPVLIEPFIAGAEATVCLIGNEPPAPLPPVLRPLDPRTGLAWHAAKRPASDGGEAIVPATLTPEQETLLRCYATRLFTALRCRDLARVDFRLDARGRPWCLEINPLPNLAPDDSFGLLGDSLGIGHAGMIARILAAALRRYGLTFHASSQERLRVS